MNRDKEGIKTDGGNLNHLRFAGDIELVSGGSAGNARRAGWRKQESGT